MIDRNAILYKIYQLLKKEIKGTKENKIKP